MYVLLAKFNGRDEVFRFCSPHKAGLKPIMADAEDWRLWHNGWADGKTGESWRLGVEINGELMRFVY